MALEPCWEYPHRFRQVGELLVPDTLPEEALLMLEERDKALEDKLCSLGGGVSSPCDSFTSFYSGGCGGTDPSSLLVPWDTVWTQGGVTISSGTITLTTPGVWHIDGFFSTYCSGPDVTIEVTIGNCADHRTGLIRPVSDGGGGWVAQFGATFMMRSANTPPIIFYQVDTGADSVSCLRLDTRMSGHFFCSEPNFSCGG